MPQEDLKQQLAHLLEENHALNEQMKRLIRTERRLSLSQQEMDRQIERVAALNHFALEAARANRPIEVLKLAIQMLFSTFPFEEAAGFQRAGSLPFSPSILCAISGCDTPNKASPIACTPHDLPKTPIFGRQEKLLVEYPSLQDFFKIFDESFPSVEPDRSEPNLLAMPLAAPEAESPEALLLFRRTSPGLSILEHLPSEEDLPFLWLISAHVASALKSCVLYETALKSEKQAQQAVKVRDEFLSIASHELRTPITPLKNELQLIRFLVDQNMLDTYPKDRLQKLVGIADAELIRLTRLIDGMLDVTRMTSGQLKLKFEEVELASLIRETVERLQPEIEISGSHVILDLEELEPGFWDRLRIEQVITNLLTNALKYGSGNPIHISARKEGAKAILSVQDQGIGITSDNQSKIFQRFERLVSVRHFGGLGLGLFITRQIVETHHGSIRVRSEPGKGSTFTVELPLRVQLDAVHEKVA